ncbi:MAG: tRNA lysidine(34) synthetase TilS [Candidatus Eremiobacteraeota bacterium]|nr:tRNA lysidine(34) synthetase TilS [Candidatus Eremiobacteraeota bacterium]
MSERFAQAVRLLGLPVAGTFVVGTSGGADSAAALLLLRKVAPGAVIFACYIDHGMRPRAHVERDIAAVRVQGRAVRARVLIRRVHLRKGAKGSPEERARRARYLALTSTARAVGATHVVTGHQRDDLVETSLLALARGSGIDGIAAMRPARQLADDIMLVRPLLWATKTQCAAVTDEAGLPAAYDETNDNLTIPRNAIRRLVGRLERSVPGASRAIVRSAALLADDKTLLDGLSVSAWRTAWRDDASRLSVATLRRMPLPLLRRVVRQAVSRSGSLRDFTYEHCNAIAEAIKERRGGRFYAGAASVVLSSGTLVVHGSDKRSANKFAPVEIDLDATPVDVATPIAAAALRVLRSAPRARARNVQHLDLAAVRAHPPLFIRLPRTGDTCVPTGRTRPISLARFLAKAGVPRSDRAAALLLCAGGRIAAVLGVRVMEPFKPKKQGPVLEVALAPTDT